MKITVNGEQELALPFPDHPQICEPQNEGSTSDMVSEGRRNAGGGAEMPLSNVITETRNKSHHFAELVLAFWEKKFVRGKEPALRKEMVDSFMARLVATEILKKHGGQIRMAMIMLELLKMKELVISDEEAGQLMTVLQARVESGNGERKENSGGGKK